MFQAGLLFCKYHAGNSNANLGALLDSASVAPAAEPLDVKLSRSSDQVQSVIKRNTFAVSM